MRNRRAERPARVAAAAASGGLLYALGYVGWGVWPCLLVFLVPFWRALETGRPGTAAAAGAIFGMTAFAAGFLWLWPLVDSFLGGRVVLGAALWLAYGAWFALGFVVYALAFHALRRRGRSLAIAGVAPLVAWEWLQPQLFPVYAGSALVDAPALPQLADLGGPLLLTALLGGANVVAYHTWTWIRGRRPPPRRVWLAGLVTLAATMAWAHLRERTVAAAAAAGPAMRVGIVQANLGLLEKRRQSLVSHRRHLEQTRRLLADGPVDLVVWPETAYVRGLRLPLPISGRPIREEIAAPLLFGASTVRDDDGRRRRANSALLVGPDGMVRDGYDKNLLIPLTEYVPFGRLLPSLRDHFPDVQDFVASTDTPALRLGPWRIATPICYEAIRPDFVRRMVRASHPNLLITLANDGWFGDSTEPWMHFALSRLRAIEHRRFLVRAANSGPSAIVDPLGRVRAHTGLLTRENLRGTVRALGIVTPYAAAGDWPGPLAAAITVLALLGRRRRFPTRGAVLAPRS